MEGTVSARCGVELPPRPSALTGKSTSAADRADVELPKGGRCTAMALHFTDAALEAALVDSGLHLPDVTRLVAVLNLSNARYLDLTLDSRITLEQVEERDAYALGALEAAFGKGFHLVSIAAGDGGRMEMIAADAFGDVIEVVEERLVTFDDLGSGSSGETHPLARPLYWAADLLGRLSIGRMTLFLIATILATVVTDPIVALLGLTVEVPLFMPLGFVLFVSLVLLLVIGIKLVAVVGRAKSSFRKWLSDELEQAVVAREQPTDRRD